MLIVDKNNTVEYVKNKIFDKFVMYNIKGQKEARLTLDGWKNFLRFKILFKDKDNDDRFKVILNMGVTRENMAILIKYLREIHKDEVGTERSIETFSPIWIDNKITDEKKSNGHIYVGKKEVDKDILYYIALSNAEAKKKIMFKLGPTPYTIIRKNGKVLTLKEQGEDAAIARADMLTDILSTFAEVLITDTEVNYTKK